MFAWQINTIEQINKMNPELKRILSTNNWGFLLIRTFYAVVKYLFGAGCVRRCESEWRELGRERMKRANKESEWRELIKKEPTFCRKSRMIKHTHAFEANGWYTVTNTRQWRFHIFSTLICPIRSSWLLRSAYHSFHNIYRTFDLKLVSLCYLKQEQCMLSRRKNGCFIVGIIHAFT